MCITTISILPSCGNYYLNVKGIAYQSIQVSKAENQSENIKDAKIIVYCDVDTNGNVDVTIENNTDEIMTIDRTKSFFIGRDGNSIVYYDPTINVLAQSTTMGHTTGASVNLGSVAKAVGVGGVAGTLLSGVTVGSANENATTTTNTTYIVDQPKLSIAPHGRASMGRVFLVPTFGIDNLAALAQNTVTDLNKFYTLENRPNDYSCAITISYSIDNEKTYEKIETILYTNSIIVSHVMQTGYVNEALRNVYITKSDLFEETWYTLCFGGAPWKGRGLSNDIGGKDENYNAYKYKHSLFCNYK